MSIFIIISLNSIGYFCLTPFNLVLFEVLFSFGVYSSISSFCLTFCGCFYELGKMATSPSIERVASCSNIPWVGCVGLATWLARGQATVGCESQGALHRRHPGGGPEGAEACLRSPNVHHTGTTMVRLLDLRQTHLGTGRGGHRRNLELVWARVAAG